MLLRRITKHVTDQNWFAVFIDFLIVVVGVFIGIQVSNWNAEKQQQEAVNSYLTSIARNIASDLEALNVTRKKRELAYNYSLRQLSFYLRKTAFKKDEITFSGKAFTQAQELHYFNANTSGFEALKSSGVLDRLQGHDIENLLYDYYDLMVQIANDEKNHNDLVKLLWLQFVSNWPKALDEWELMDPYPLSDNRFQSLQPVYAELLAEKSTIVVFERAMNITNLIQKYERLEHLGNAFIAMVESNSMSFNSASTESLEKIHDYSSELGYPNIMIDGQVALHSYWISAADSNDFKLKGFISDDIDESMQQRVFDYHTLEQSDNSMHISYPGTAEWAGVWVFGGLTGSDFSSFSTLQIELKGDLGGEKILLNMEDIDDLQDGSSTRYELEVTDEWQTYNIDLADFKTADLSKLSSVIGFVFLNDEAQSFSVRTIRFVNAEETL